MISTPKHDFDVLVIGGGPAGCAVSTVLAQQGRRVAVLEKQPRRRYSVGESLIPFCYDALDRMGLNGQLEGAPFSFPKHSVQFASIEGKVSRSFYFFQHTDHPRAKTWQVVRAEFDKLLRDNAEEKGVQFFEQTRARELLYGDDGEVVGVRANDPAGYEMTFKAKVTVDATGRDTFAQSRLGWRVPDKKLKKMAIWTYFEGATRDDGYDEGTTTIAYLPNKGWFWNIPLPNDRVSVGLVGDKDYLFDESKDLGEIFEREVAKQGWLRGRLENARQTDEYRVTSEFSYRSRHCATDGLVLIGDAFSFLDPVFSSGVYFALTSGVMAADAIDAALEADDVSAGRFAEYGEAFRKQMEPMRKLVYAFYDDGFSFGKFLKEHPDLRPQVTDVLIGDLERDYEEGLFRTMSDFADLPEPLEHGRPAALEATKTKQD
ncbi:MAG: NAD(P)/FAD-dependent oxidoreductase [Planctomycetota bacterium]